MINQVWRGTAGTARRHSIGGSEHDPPNNPTTQQLPSNTTSVQGGERDVTHDRAFAVGGVMRALGLIEVHLFQGTPTGQPGL